MSDGKWIKVKNVKEFMDQNGNKRTGPHSFSKKILNWQYCSHCGLVGLKNDASRKAMKSICVWIED